VDFNRLTPKSWKPNEVKRDFDIIASKSKVKLN
jgi:hypothetical protein